MGPCRILFPHQDNFLHILSLIRHLFPFDDAIIANNKMLVKRLKNEKIFQTPLTLECKYDILLTVERKVEKV